MEAGINWEPANSVPNSGREEKLELDRGGRLGDEQEQTKPSGATGSDDLKTSANAERCLDRLDFQTAFSKSAAPRPPEVPERPEPPAPPPPPRRSWSGTIPAHSRPPEPDHPPPGQFHTFDTRNRPWMHGWGMPAGHGGFIPVNFGNDWDWRWRGDAFNEMEWQWNAWDSRWPQDSRIRQPDPDPSRGQPRREEGPTQQEMRLTSFMEKLDKDLKEGVQDLKHGDVGTLAPVASLAENIFPKSISDAWVLVVLVVCREGSDTEWQRYGRVDGDGKEGSRANSLRKASVGGSDTEWWTEMGTKETVQIACGKLRGEEALRSGGRRWEGRKPKRYGVVDGDGNEGKRANSLRKASPGGSETEWWTEMGSNVMVSAALERAAGKGYLALVETVETLFVEEAPRSPKIMLDIPTFASLLERLVLDPSSYRPTTVRLLLNLALSEDSPVLPLVPDSLSEPEARASMLGDVGPPGDQAQQRNKEKDKEESDKEELDGESVNEEEDVSGQEWPETLLLRGCTCWPELNGIFARTRDFDQLSQHQRPVYQKTVLMDSAETRVFCFFHKFASKNQSCSESANKKRKLNQSEGQSGWWIGTQVGGKTGLLGFSDSHDELPPGQDWRLKLKGQKSFQEDPCGFVSQEDLCVEALQRLDLQRLHGRVSGPDNSVKYFGHFCALLHLEYFVEIAAIRRRTSKRSAEDLAKGGWALAGLQARDIFSKGKGKGKDGKKDGRKGQKGEQSGKGIKDGFQITLAMPRSPKVDVDRLRFKRGDSVILSATHPLKDTVGEGQVQEINDAVIVISIEGAETPLAKGGTWRVDKGSNRVSYTRQLSSLVSLCGGDGAQVGEAAKIFELITRSKVGDLDSWTARWSEKESASTKALPKPSLAEGDKVRLCGLKSEELNGQEGRVVSVICNTVRSNEKKSDQRVHVQLQDSIKAVRVINVEKVNDEPMVETGDSNKDSKGDTGDSQFSIASLAAEAVPCNDEKLSTCRDDLSSISCTESQKRAIGATFEQRCTIIQGPPGTGKTTTAVQVLKYWAQMGLKPLLAVADGNIAVDNIAVGLAKYGDLKTVRVGRPEKIRPELEKITLDNQCKLYKQLAQEKRQADQRAAALASLEKLPVADLKAKAIDLKASVDAQKLSVGVSHTSEPNGPDEAGPKAADVLDDILKAVIQAEEASDAAKKADELSKRSPAEVEADEKRARLQARKEDAAIQMQVLKDADILCAQLITAGGNLFSKFGPFKGILIDEIAQATELVSIVPIVQRCCERLVLAGDHCQLPPTVQSPEAERRGLSLSLYGRLVKEGLEPYFLDTQFRSHPKLMEWVAGSIYEGRLQSGILEDARPSVGGFEWPKKKVPVAFVEMGRWAGESVEYESKMNHAEAERVISIIESVLDAGCSADQVGIITPYMAQVRLLRMLWRTRCQEKMSRKKAKKSLNQLRELEIASVDNFQGREKELIVFSAVRNNAAGRVGFLADWRRLNVMLTRARRGLIVVGNAHTLCKDPYWQKWLEWCRAHGVVVDKQAWHAVVRAAKNLASSKRIKSLVHHLFDFEQAPQKEKAFRRFAEEKLADKLQGPDDLDLLWEAVFGGLQEVAAATALRSQEEEWMKAVTAVATAKLDEIPCLEDKEGSSGSLTRVCAVAGEVGLLLHRKSSGHKILAKMIDYYKAHLAAFSETDDRPNKQIFKEMRESLPSEWFEDSESLKVRLSPAEHQQAARQVWKANREDGIRTFQRRVVPWAQPAKTDTQEEKVELGNQISNSDDKAMPKLKTRKRTRSARKADGGGATAAKSAASCESPKRKAAKKENTGHGTAVHQRQLAATYMTRTSY
eukprot:s3785_g5.t5